MEYLVGLWLAVVVAVCLYWLAQRDDWPGPSATA